MYFLFPELRLLINGKLRPSPAQPDMAAASDTHPIGWTLIGTRMWIGLDSEIR